MRQPELSHGASLLGIPVSDVRPTIPAWERVRNDALRTRGLPPIPPRCYGSMWMGLASEDAEAVVALGVEHHDALSGAYRAAYAHATDGHSKSHARLSPDEEFVPYIIHVLAHSRPSLYYGRKAGIGENVHSVQLSSRACGQAQRTR